MPGAGIALVSTLIVIAVAQTGSLFSADAWNNVTFTAATGVPADIGNRTSGAVDRTFDTAGTFQFRCTIHPTTMTGSVTVNP